MLLLVYEGDTCVCSLSVYHCVSLLSSRAFFFLRGAQRCHYTRVCGIARAERDGTRAETRFPLSPKRTSPFKSVQASVQSTAGSRDVSISLSNAGYTAFGDGARVLATHSIRQFPPPFTSPPVRHRVPPGFKRALSLNRVNGVWP